MIPRIGALLFLVSLIVGGAWYVLRDTPERKVLRLREEARSLLRNAADLERAEELNEEILKLIPGSLYDLLFKAELNELKHTALGLKEALRIYDEILASGDPNYLGVAFYKARVCRALGLMADARAALLSVMDQYPYLALMELGETAMTSVAPLDALRWYTRAREVAGGGVDEAHAREAEAGAYKLLLALSSTPVRRAGEDEGERGRLQEEREKALASLRERSRASLMAALSFVRSPETPSSSVEARRWLLWAASLSEKLLPVRRPEDTPCQDGVVLLEGKLKGYAPILKEESAVVRVSLGTLRLLAVRHEAHRLPAGQEVEQRRLAEKDFLMALGKTPEEGKTIVKAASGLPGGADREAFAATLQSEEARSYLQTLSGISRVYLAVGEARRLLEDRSDLALSRRIADVLEAADAKVSGIFALLLGLARVSSGEPGAAKQLFERYMSSVAGDTRPEAALDVAEHVLRHAPGRPLVFDSLDLFHAAGGRALEFVGRRVSLLVTAGGQDRLQEEAQKRLDLLLASAAAEAKSPFEVTGVARVSLSVKGSDAALDLLRTARRREPQDFEVSWLLVEILMEKARALEKAGEGEAALDSYREALHVCLPLFLMAPARSQDLLRTTAEASRKLLVKESEEISADVLKPFFPAAPDSSVAGLSLAFEAYLLGKYGQALDRADAIGQAQNLRPFLSFLKGSCHVGLAGHLRRDQSQARSDVAREALESRRAEHVRQAMAEFRSGLDFVANRLELLILEVEELPPGGDVPGDLLQRLREVSESEDAGHRGYFLLAQALHRRLVHRYEDPTVKNSDIARLLLAEQKALRNCIRRYPYFNPAYRALAETFLVSERERYAILGGPPRRELLSPDLQKAIDVLKAAPEPDEEIVSALAAHLEAGGRPAEATPYLERLAQLLPGAEVFGRLFDNYLTTSNPTARVFLHEAAQPGQGAADAGMSPGRLKAILDLKEIFETIPGYQGIRLSFLGNLTALQVSRASSAEKPRLRRESIEHYRKAVEAYDQKGIQPPPVILNNLAWFLAEDDDEALRAQAVVVAARGKALVPNPSGMANMHDTHAWALYRNGKLTEAEKAFRDLIAVVDTPTFRYHLARVLLDLRKYDDALGEVRKARGAVKDFPESGEALRLEAEIREARRQAIGE